MYLFLAVTIWKSGKMFSKMEYPHFSKVFIIYHVRTVNTVCIILDILIHIIIQRQIWYTPDVLTSVGRNMG